MLMGQVEEERKEKGSGQRQRNSKMRTVIKCRKLYQVLFFVTTLNHLSSSQNMQLGVQFNPSVVACSCKPLPAQGGDLFSHTVSQRHYYNDTVRCAGWWIGCDTAHT
jgi:hypothetical protein